MSHWTVSLSQWLLFILIKQNDRKVSWAAWATGDTPSSAQHLLYLCYYFHRVWPFFFPPQTSLWEQFNIVCWSSCGWCEPSNSATLIQWPCLSLSVPVWPAHPCTFASTLSFLRASSSEPRQQFHLFCQSWACTQPSLVVFPPAQLDAKPVDFPHMPAFPFLYLYFTLSLYLWPCQCLNQWGRVLRRCRFCGYVILNLLYCVQSKWKLLNDRVLQ